MQEAPDTDHPALNYEQWHMSFIFAVMKIKNEDLKTLTGIKQYFLDPPRSFRLYGFAIPKAEEAIHIVEKYPNLQPMLDGMKESYDAMKELEGKNEELRRRMIAFGNLFGYLNR